MSLLWPYSGLNESGLPVRGKVVADDIDGAKASLKKMGIKWDKIGNDATQVEEVVKADPVEESRPVEQDNGHLALIRSFQKTVDIPKMDLSTPMPTVRAMPSPKTRQYVLFGTGQAVQLQSKPFLERGGRVIHASMSPDSSGRPHVLLVIEAEEEKHHHGAQVNYG